MMKFPLLEKICVVGGGKISLEYSKILSLLGVDHQIVSRSLNPQISNFIRDDVRNLSPKILSNFDGYIICVQPQNNYELTKFILEKTNSPILVEKPLALNYLDHKALKDRFDRIYVALNRRKFESTIKVKKLIRKANVTKLLVEVTEIESRIQGPKEVINHWPLANTIHLIDVALYISGIYSKLNSHLNWENLKGITRGKISTPDELCQLLFVDFFPNTGNWGIEVITERERFILRPLEELKIQLAQTIRPKLVELDEQKFKHGFFKNVCDFISLKRNKFIKFEEYEFLIQVISFLYRD